MKKVYLLFLLSSCFSLILFSIINYKRDQLVFKDNINNLEKLIDDSIIPSCSYNFNNSSNTNENYIKELNIMIPESRNWSVNLFNAFIENSSVIKEKYKKRFDAQIYVNNPSNDLCKLPARVRISGDWKDHIQSINGNIVSSLDVSLKRGNINGITKFKLFLPSTRNGDSEVLISLLLKEMGYLSPRTRIINVNVNNQSFQMIFQEKAAKELLEHNKLRESVIIETDESLLWQIRSKGGHFSNGNIFPKVINKKWIKKNPINQKIGLKAASNFSKAILESWNHGGLDQEITFSDNLLSNKNIKAKKILSQYKAHLIASGSTHALYNINRRFYYDPINNSFLPIYYDGNSSVRSLDKTFNFTQKFKDRFITRDITSQEFENAINQVKSINLNKFALKLKSSGVKINSSELTKIKTQLIKNLIFLKENSQINLNTKFEKNPLIRKIQKNVKYGLILYSQSDSNFYLCNLKDFSYNSDFICNKKDLNGLELTQLICGDYIRDNIKYYFLGDKFNPKTENYYDEKPNELKLINLENKIYIRKFGNPEIKFNKKEKLISIEIKNFNEKVLFNNSKLEGWNIKVFAKDINTFEKINSRIDTNLLTSLITIKDSQLENLKIYIDGGKHEDSLNIINSSGSIDEIDIKNSFQDAIDFDFSNLRVNKIFVNNAGNDCLDTSAGQYYINKIDLNICKDKGVSVGEESTLNIKTANIQNTNIAMVSKDSSKLIVKKAFLKNNNLCIAAYNKKQEFGPAYISVPNKLCPKAKIAIQNISILEKQ